MKNILSRVNSIQNNKIVFWILQVLWGLTLATILFLLCAFIAELLNTADFEYYGYHQWPWFYHNMWICRRYLLIDLLLVILCVAYSIRVKSKNTLLAILFIALPYIYLYCQVLLLDLNG